MSIFPARLKQLAGHSSVKNAALLYVVQISTYVFPLITLPYLSRILSPAKLGLLVFAQTFTWYFYTLTEYGFDLTATREVAIHKDNPEELSRIFSSVIAAKFFLTGLGFLLMSVVVFLTPTLRKDWALFPISFMTVLGGLFFPMWLYQGLQKMGWVAARDFSARLAATVLVFLVVRRESDYLWAAAFQSGAVALAGLVSLIMAPRVCGIRFQMPAWKDVAAQLRAGWTVFTSMAVLSLTGTNIVVLGFVAAPNEVGYYSAASRLIIALRNLVVPMVTAIYPYISHKAAHSAGGAIRLLQKYALLPAIPFLLGSVVLFVEAPLVVRLVFGPKYQPTVVLLRIMAFSPFLMTVHHVYATYFMLAFGYSKQWSRLMLQCTVLNYVLMAALLWFVRPAMVMAIVLTAVDVYGTAAAYLFYARKIYSGKGLDNLGGNDFQ